MRYLLTVLLGSSPVIYLLAESWQELALRDSRTCGKVPVKLNNGRKEN